VLSCAPVALWLDELKRRAEFIARWLVRGEDEVMWLPGLFRPSAFITAMLQRHSRLHRVAADLLTFDVEVVAALSSQVQVEFLAFENSERISSFSYGHHVCSQYYMHAPICHLLYALLPTTLLSLKTL
jgi:hypothetical protein